MQTTQIRRIESLSWLLRATGVDGREIQPIPCVSEEEAETRASALTELGYLNCRVRVTKRAPDLAAQ